MPDLLLEIGTEEVPASAVVPALERLGELLRDLLLRERLACGGVRTLGTPRRLAVLASHVPGRQEDAVLEHRGPTRAVAFDPSGNPTRAAEGFARRFGLAPADLAVRSTESGEYVFALQRVEGRPAVEILAEALPGLLPELPFPKFMRWGEGRYRFSRPIRWITCLLGDQVVPFTAGGVASGEVSAGHRFLPVRDGADRHRIRVERAEEYLARMEDARVVVDADQRRRMILQQGDALAAAEGIRVVWDPDLLHEVVYVVEYPTVFLGEFSEEYLRLPRPVLVSAMRKHQRYFTLERPDGSLAPRFLAVRNGGERGLEIVRTGNERVLAFRFNDAAHHYTEDQKSTLSEKRGRLERVVFMEKLGTMLDKTERLERTVELLARRLGDPAVPDPAREAAALSKADLASHMVAELPELQGVIGREYARLEGLPDAVAEAIGEQYLPRAAGDALPRSPAGKLLALADRLDLLAGAFSLGHVPTGSADRFGLRRAAAGVVALLEALPASLRLSELLDEALDALSSQPCYAAADPRPRDTVRAELVRFFRPRVEALLEEHAEVRALEETRRARFVEALLEAGYDSIPALLERAQFLAGKLGDPGSVPVFQAGMRVRNILKPTDLAPTEADLNLLEHPTEVVLRGLLESRAESLRDFAGSGDWDSTWPIWAELAPVLDRFFVDVLVNVEDPGLRAARLGLLRILDRSFLALADFSRVPFE